MLDQLASRLQRLEVEGLPIVVGYSGGADSTCLIHLLKRLGQPFVAAHLNHSQREEGKAEQKLCEQFCAHYDIPFVTGVADVPRMSLDLKMGVEEAGRLARYNFLEQARRATESAYIVTAHTKTDLVETVLFNIARGSGLSGLAGVPERRDRIVRPLLFATREETRAYCAEHSLWFHDDPCNDSPEFARARIRNEVVPTLEQIKPGASDSIWRLSQIAIEEDTFLNGAAAAALERCEVRLNGDHNFLSQDVELAFGTPDLAHLPPVLFKRAVRLAVEALGATLSYDQTQIIADNVGRYPGSVTAEGGKVVCEWNDALLTVRVLQPTEPFRFKLTFPGETESDEFGWRLTARKLTESPTTRERRSMRIIVPEDAVRGDLYLRSVQSGDSIQPLGFDGTRKLGDVLADAQLTSAARARLPIICDFVGPIWAPGVCLSHRMYRENFCGPAIEITFEPITEGFPTET